MATESQINANRQNAQHSTGPRTDAGKTASSRNHLTLGLYTRQDYVKHEERDLYQEFCQTMYSELTPASLLEEALASEITGAAWRLRRCSSAEGALGDFDDTTDKTRRAIERARASAHSLLHRSINQLRKLQTERITRTQLRLEDTADSPLAESRKICQALNVHLRNGKLLAPPPVANPVDAIMNCTQPDWGAIDLEIATEKQAEGHAAMAALGLNCKPAPMPSPTRSAASPHTAANMQSPLTGASPTQGKAA